MSIKAFKFNRMKKAKYNVIGVMSGTSCDGIDLAHCELSVTDDNQWGYSIIKAQTIPYNSLWQRRLSAAVTLDKTAVQALDLAYTSLLNRTILDFIHEFKISELDLICSHGHTVWHKPGQGITWQIGNLESIAQGLPCPVVCDFRTQDVALKGQGAPLVPIGDQLLFQEFDACINLGGFANISYQLQDAPTIAYDLCPFNIVLNYWANKLGSDFDENGHYARLGTVHPELLKQLNTLDYYRLTPPKSLGMEWVQSNFYPLYERFNLNPKDWLATAARHMVDQIHTSATKFDRILLTGGGAFNGFILELHDEAAPLKFFVPNKALINYKEALIFGLLGVLRYRGEVNCLASVTGAIRDHSSGVIWNPVGR
jgi:anhydro-N-acetylmuramic acid kinase